MRDPEEPSVFYRQAMARQRRSFLAHLGIAVMILVLVVAVMLARYA